MTILIIYSFLLFISDNFVFDFHCRLLLPIWMLTTVVEVFAEVKVLIPQFRNKQQRHKTVCAEVFNMVRFELKCMFVKH